jgi:ATP-dependent Clp protease adapter protein ClpS
MPATITEVDLGAVWRDALDDLWLVEVLNDDITTFGAVIAALREIFGHTAEAAEALAWRVHREGSAVVAVMEKEEAERSTARLHTRKIQARCRPA